ncbi:MULTISPECIES: hypothetical protein [Vibrio]|uniref:hypothetical protein n=1 Tax=Vibrio TaxID=662 RepID=UPI00078D4426|nr:MULTISPECIES: hypothetical protein [Vibrio]BAU70990.1 hypothetical protein [Vibrio sp. 04Ya108]BBM67749.1 hypothetical protein VA249_43950 [Vibrio alfacsensis]BCN26920.1 hypothetical protein VYA_41120 [Vibrio alfacsensis]
MTIESSTTTPTRKHGQQCTLLIPIGEGEDRFGTGVILDINKKIKVVITDVADHDDSMNGRVIDLHPDRVVADDSRGILAFALQKFEKEYGLERLNQTLANCLLTNTQRLTNGENKLYKVSTEYLDSSKLKSITGEVIAKRK